VQVEAMSGRLGILTLWGSLTLYFIALSFQGLVAISALSRIDDRLIQIENHMQIPAGERR
jgi:hypothetical protein